MPAIERLERNAALGGTNCILAFQSNDGSFSTRVRVRILAHNWTVVATESHARVNRAMYPHQRAVGQFVLGLELKGYKEFEPFMNFMRSYVYAWRQGGKPMMSVTMSVRNFARKGVPVKGMSIGDHMGSNVFAPNIVFESAQDPLDNTILNLSQASSTSFSGAEADAKNFFYPFSPGSEDTNVKAETVYDYKDYLNTDTTFGGTLGSALGNAIGTVAGNATNIVNDLLDKQGRQDGRG